MKTCKTCQVTESYKWFSGPLCRKCYRAQPEVREKELANTRLYKIKNPDKIKAKKQEWRQQNPHYDRDREKVDPLFKLKKRLRTRLNHAIKGNYKTGSAVIALGCTIEELKVYLENQFEPWMNWSNHGPYNSEYKTWHIDHIKPLDSFDLSDLEQFNEACHYSNLKPLLAKENLSKGDKR